MGFSSFKSGRQDLNLRPDDPETSAWLCRSLVAALLFQRAVVNEGRLVVTLGTAEPSDILSAETSDPYYLGLSLISSCEALALRPRFCSGRALGRVSSAG